MRVLRLMPFLVCLIAVAGFARQQPRAAGTIDGLVADSALAPMDDVTVSIVGTRIAVVTSENGRFRFVDVPAGRYQVLARRIGSEPAIAEVHVSPGEVARPALTLEPVATKLAGVRVTETSLSPKLREFEARRRAGEGHFVTLEQIEKRNAVFVTDLLAGIPSVRVVNGVAFNSRFSITQRCAYAFYVDNLPRSGADLPSVKEIAGMEIYAGPATMPPQFKRPTGVWCGIILIWTKDGSTP